MPRKPDIFERMVEKELKGGMRDTMPIAEFRYLAGLLLRRQHRAYVKILRDELEEGTVRRVLIQAFNKYKR